MIRISTLPPRMSATRSFSDCGLIHRVGIHWIGVEDSLADIAQGLIDAREPKRAQRAVDDLPQSPRWSRDGFSDPSTARPETCLAPTRSIPGSHVAAERHVQSSRKRLDLRRPHRQPMIRFRSCRTRRAFDHIQPAHLAGIRIAPLGEVPRVAREARESRIEEIGIERKNYIRIFEKSYCVSTGCPKASFAPSSTLSRFTGS